MVYTHVMNKGVCVLAVCWIKSKDVFGKSFLDETFNLQNELCANCYLMLNLNNPKQVYLYLFLTLKYLP